MTSAASPQPTVPAAGPHPEEPAPFRPQHKIRLACGNGLRADIWEAFQKRFGIPKVPGRITERLVGTLKRSLANLRSVSRYNERDRVVALSGLLTARVLDVDLPRTSTGLTLYEEYDRLMQSHGRRTEFGA